MSTLKTRSRMHYTHSLLIIASILFGISFSSSLSASGTAPPIICVPSNDGKCIIQGEGSIGGDGGAGGSNAGAAGGGGGNAGNNSSVTQPPPQSNVATNSPNPVNDPSTTVSNTPPPSVQTPNAQTSAILETQINYMYRKREANSKPQPLTNESVVIVQPPPQLPSGPVCTLISGHYNACNDGTVTDTNTKLMWKRCAEGQTWTGSTCAGDGIGITWDEAMPNGRQKTWTTFAGYSDWQVPTRKNLLTLVYCSTGKPKTWNDTSSRCEGKYQRPTIDTTAFPNVDGWWFWSASTVASVSTHAWVLYFGYGDDGWGQRSHTSRVRLMRVGQ